MPTINFIVNNGELYIPQKYCGIHFLIFTTDNLHTYSFSNRKNRIHYVKVRDALNWFKKELEYGKDIYPKRELDMYRRYIKMYTEELKKPIKQ